MRLRWAAALLVAGSVAVPAYALQRLVDALQEPPITAVIAQATIPYYWRVALSAMQGLSAGIITAAWVSSPAAAERLLGLLPALVSAAVALSVLAMLLRP